MFREQVLEMLKAQGYEIIREEHQKNGIWYRVKRSNSDITISLWCENDNNKKFVMEFENNW